MIIERIQIEEGFLNGFDVCPQPGLNVVIGARHRQDYPDRANSVLPWR